MALKKVKPGDPLNIPAETFNTLIDAAHDFQARQQVIGRQSQRQARATGIVLVRNDSGEGRDRFDILGIDGPLITPTDNPVEFENRIAIGGVKPSVEGLHAGRFVVLLEPLAENAIGRAMVAGVCVARVEMIDETHRYADARPDESGQLISAAIGAAQLLWVQPEEDRTGNIAWAIVRLGGGGSNVETLTVRVKRTGGSSGDADTRCSYVYDVYPLHGELNDDTRLVAGVSNVLGRADRGRYRHAADGTPALAWWDTTSEDPDSPSAWTLVDVADEVEDVATCNAAGGL